MMPDPQTNFEKKKPSKLSKMNPTYSKDYETMCQKTSKVPPSKEARPEQLVPFGEYYRRHILKDLPPRPCFSSENNFLVLGWQFWQLAGLGPRVGGWVDRS